MQEMLSRSLMQYPGARSRCNQALIRRTRRWVKVQPSAWWPTTCWVKVQPTKKQTHQSEKVTFFFPLRTSSNASIPSLKPSIYRFARYAFCRVFLASAVLDLCKHYRFRSRFRLSCDFPEKKAVALCQRYLDWREKPLNIWTSDGVLQIVILLFCFTI